MQNHGRVFEAAEARTGTSCLKPHSSVTGILKSTLSERDESIIIIIIKRITLGKAILKCSYVVSTTCVSSLFM